MVFHSKETIFEYLSDIFMSLKDDGETDDLTTDEVKSLLVLDILEEFKLTEKEASKFVVEWMSTIDEFTDAIADMAWSHF